MDAFGQFPYRVEPRPGNPERIVILGSWVRTHLVEVAVPQLERFGIRRPITVHYRAGAPLVALWAAWEAAGLLDLIPTFDGLWVPRFKRQTGTETERAAKAAKLGPASLSNHAWGTAFDIGARAYPQGRRVKATDPFAQLFPVAEAHGWYPGARFSPTPDPMHFELATHPTVVMSPAPV